MFKRLGEASVNSRIRIFTAAGTGVILRLPRAFNSAFIESEFRNQVMHKRIGGTKICRFFDPLHGAKRVTLAAVQSRKVDEKAITLRAAHRRILEGLERDR